jgi:hypothetical protein
MSGAEPALTLLSLGWAGSQSQVQIVPCSLRYVRMCHVLSYRTLSYAMLSAFWCRTRLHPSSFTNYFCPLITAIHLCWVPSLCLIPPLLLSHLHSFPLHYLPPLLLITGPGVCKIKVTTPEGTDVGLRSPLLPFEASHTTGKFTGGRLLKRSKKGGEKAYGWRA